MKNEASDLGSVDRWLQEGLEPEPEIARRVANRALRSTPPRNHWPIPIRWAVLTSAVIALLVVAVWIGDGDSPPSSEEPIRITNYGELVAAVDPEGNVWLHSPDRLTRADAPRLIITLGAENEE